MTEEKKTQLTQTAFNKLKEELDYLEGEARTKIIRRSPPREPTATSARTRSTTRPRTSRACRRPASDRLRAMLENAEIIEATDDDVVEPGKLVTIKHEGDDEPETYLLGLREEKGGDHDILTPESPIGQALIGRTAGETVTAKVPAGDLKIEIVEVKAP